MKNSKKIIRKDYGEWALVTGASSGIGKSFAELLSDQGINTICISNEKDQQAEICKSFKQKYNIESIPCYVDLANENFLKKINETIGDRIISILICCASFGFVGKFEDQDVEIYKEMIHVNVYSYLRLIHQFYSDMIKRNNGAIILTSSVNVSSPLGLSAVYTATKAFEFYLGEALCWESRDSDLDILVLLPGPTRTNFQKTAGTKVTSYAMDPLKVAEIGLKNLGKKWFTIAGWRSKLFFYIGQLLFPKRRIKLASKTYLRQLLKKNR
ncbi:MAG: SDR family NAD(P)-dependent oxidoreductase [Candidatus Lokiarchaeota archaeon]|nr:SDR family NAD(P)-dependent oxidoreductase [Candidatus Lokiarchaeota archaeon]